MQCHCYVLIRIYGFGLVLTAHIFGTRQWHNYLANFLHSLFITKKSVHNFHSLIHPFSHSFPFCQFSRQRSEHFIHSNLKYCSSHARIMIAAFLTYAEIFLRAHSMKYHVNSFWWIARRALCQEWIRESRECIIYEWFSHRFSSANR